MNRPTRAPPPKRSQDGWDVTDWTTQAISKGLVMNTIRCDADASTAREFAQLAKLADGTFVRLDQSGGMGATATPFDDELAKMSDMLATKTLVDGSAAAQTEGRAKLGEFRALAPSVAADRLSSNAKAAPRDASFAGELDGAVDLTATPEKLATLKEADLPPEVRTIGKCEAWVRAQAEEKKAPEHRATEVSKQRDAWLSKNAKRTIRRRRSSPGARSGARPPQCGAAPGLSSGIAVVHRVDDDSAVEPQVLLRHRAHGLARSDSGDPQARSEHRVLDRVEGKVNGLEVARDNLGDGRPPRPGPEMSPSAVTPLLSGTRRAP